MMLKKSVVLILSLLILVTAGPVLAEEMAREGSISSRATWAVSMTALPMGEELVQINYDGYGVAASETGKGLLHNASAHVVGGMLIQKGIYNNDSGLICYTRPDGDQIFLTYKTSGQMGKGAKGTGTIVGGTGKFEGITGTMEFTRFQLRPPAKGAGASFSLGKGTWKLPEKK
jgi:hypothetical protein